MEVFGQELLHKHGDVKAERAMTPTTLDGSEEAEVASTSIVGLAAQKRQRELEIFPRVRFAHLSTPLEYCPRLSEALGGVEIYVKRDDCTGLASGGNKTRKLGKNQSKKNHQNSNVCILAFYTISKFSQFQNTRIYNRMADGGGN
jgi:hypothetical protein